MAPKRPSRSTPSVVKTRRKVVEERVEIWTDDEDDTVDTRKVTEVSIDEKEDRLTPVETKEENAPAPRSRRVEVSTPPPPTPDKPAPLGQRIFDEVTTPPEKGAEAVAAPPEGEKGAEEVTPPPPSEEVITPPPAEPKQATPLRKRRRKRRGSEKGYKRYVFKVLKMVHPGMTVSSKAMTILDMYMQDMFERIVDEAAKLGAYVGKVTMTSMEIQDAVRLVLPGELGKHAVAEGSKAVSKYMKT